jgi:hypothetical protein
MAPLAKRGSCRDLIRLRGLAVFLLLCCTTSVLAAAPWLDYRCNTSDRVKVPGEQKFGGASASASDDWLMFRCRGDFRQSSYGYDYYKNSDA